MRHNLIKENKNENEKLQMFSIRKLPLELWSKWWSYGRSMSENGISYIINCLRAIFLFFLIIMINCFTSYQEDECELQNGYEFNL